MAPKKNTKAYKSEYTTVLFGIHRETLAVVEAWQTREGKLSVGSNSHSVDYGRRASSEFSLVWNVTDVRSTPIQMYEANCKRITDELEAIATKMRDERAIASPTPETDL